MKRTFAHAQLFLLVVLLFSATYSHAQLTIDFRMAIVSTDVDDMDAAMAGSILGGDSDPVWQYAVTDLPFATTLQGSFAPGEINCAGSYLLNDVFFTQTYPAGCNTPTDYTLELTAGEKDNGSSNVLTGDDAYVNQTYNIPAISLTYPTGGWLSLGTYTLTAPGTDCGSTGTVTWTFEVEYQTVGQTEYIAPSISCLPGSVTQNVDAGSCGAIVNGISPVSATDNCGVAAQTWIFSGATVDTSAALGINDASGMFFNPGITTVTYTIQDYSTNAASCSFTVEVIDNVNPSMTCPNDTTLSPAATCTAIVNNLAPVIVDNCTPAFVTWTMSGSTTGSSPLTGINDVSGESFNPGVTSVVYEMEDPGGNSLNCNFDVTVIDNTLPLISCPSNITQNNDAGSCGAIINYTAPVGTDNCTGASTLMTAGLTSGSLFPIGTTTVTYEVTDLASNTATCSFDVTISDTENPVISCPGNIAQNNSTGSCGAIVNYVTPVGTDNCTGSTTSMIAGQASGTLFPIGTTIVTYQVVDASGNSAQCSFNVTITDTQNPVLSCPANINVNNDPGSCGAIVTYTTPVGTDNCPGATTTMTAGQATGTLFPIGTTTVSYQVIDASGNTANCSFDVTVSDNESPVLTCPTNITVNSDPGVCGATVTYTAPVGTDNCPGVTTTMTAGQASGTVFPIGTTVVTYQATDASGNVTTCSFNVTVNDAELPVISCPATFSQNNDAGVCGATINYTTPVGTDNCLGASTVMTSGLASGSLFPIGTTTVGYQVTDASGNVASCSFDVTVVDAENPVITCPSNISQNSNLTTCSAVVTYTAPVYSDNCPSPVMNMTAGFVSGALFPVGVTPVTYQVTDASGNTSQCTFNVTINDNVNPIINCPSDINANTDPGSCDAVITYTAPVGTDNCSGSVTSMLSGLTSGSAFPIGTTTVTYQVIDASSNSAQCSFDVTVDDNENPVITCPSNITTNNDLNACGATVAYGTPVGTDNCAGATTTMTAGLTSGAFYPIGVTTNSFQVVDASGNTANCSFTVTVNDSQIPLITCPGNINVNNDAGICGATVNYSTPVGTDNCPSPVTSMLTGQASGTQFPIGTTTVTYQVVDANSNSAQCSFNVTVTDNQNPTLSCPSNITVPNLNNNCGAIVSYTAPVGTDNCPGVSTTMTAGFVSGALFPGGVTVQTFQSIDAAGNTSTCSFTVTVEDQQNPVITCPADITTNNDVGNCSAVVNYTAPVGTDNCPSPVTSLLSGLTSGSTFPIGTTTVIYQVVDGNSNTTQCSFNVIVNDTENPTISCPANITANNSTGLCGGMVNYTAPVGTDNCPSSTTSLFSGQASGTIFPIGTSAVVYQVTDASGNTAQCSFDVTVIDTQNPTISCPTAVNISNGLGACDAVVNYSNPVVNDNCAGSTFALFSGLPTGSNFPVGTSTVVYEATDASGNTAQCSFDINVFDTENPTITCPADVTVGNDLGTCGAVVNYTAPVGVDNCTGATTTLLSGLASGLTFPVGTTTVSYQVVDASGNNAQCAFNVTVDDTENPTISCPANMTVNNDPGICGATVTYTTPVGTDNCPSPTTSLAFGQPSGSVFTAGSSPIIYEVQDAAGNITQCSFTITVVDIENPTITCPTNLTVSNDPGTCTATVTYGVPVTADNCGIATTSVIAGPASGSVFNAGITTITYETADNDGNTAQCTFDIEVIDTENPTISCPSNILVNNDPGACGAIVNFTNPVGVDNCAGPTTSLLSGIASGGSFPLGTTVNTFEVIDAAGNSATCSFDITVNDAEAPGIICPTDQIVSNDPGVCGAVVNYLDPVVTDNCPGQTFAMISGVVSGSLFPSGVTTTTFQAIDANGNTAQCSFDVTVNDTEAPTVTCPATVTANSNPGQCSATVTYGTPVITDNCAAGGSVVIAGSPSGSVFPVGTSTITYEGSDVAGNTAQCTFDIIVIDVEDPTITCPANISTTNDPGTCGATVSYPPIIGLDNCTGVTTAIFSGLPSGSVFPGGITTVVFEATDGAGNTAQCSFDVNVIDTEIPSAVCASDITVNNDSSVCGAIVVYADPVVTDNCTNPTINVLSGLPSGSTFPIGTTTNLLEIVDVSGNTATCTFDITVVDVEPPVVICPATQTVAANANCEFTLQNYVGSATIDDNCGSYTVLQTPAPGTIHQAFADVTLIATDQFGNVDSCTFQVLANDNTAPILQCPTQHTDYFSNVCDLQLPDYVGLLTITENCNVYNYVQTPAPGTMIYADTILNFVVTDAAGNTSSCSFDLFVQDSTPPTVSCPPQDIEVFFSSICDFEVQDYSAFVTTYDNCGPVTYIQSPLPGDTIYALQPVSIIATDINGNTTTCTFNVIPKDTVPPALMCPPDQVEYFDDSCAFTIPDYMPLATIITTCENIPLTQNPPPGTVVTGPTTIALSGTDVSGNVNICTFNVTLLDTISPIITCPADIYSCDTTVTYSPPTATDNCNVLSIVRTSGPVSGSAFPMGTTTITYEATDDYGNTDVCSFDVIVLPLPELSSTEQDITCYGETDGAIDVTVNSGSAPFTYEWSTGATTEDINGLGQGDYTIVVVDKYGCTDTLTESIVEPPILDVSYTTILKGCNGFTDGYIKLGVQGGTPPYSFNWSPAVGAGTTAQNLPPGDYSISLVDVQGCSVDTTFTVEEADTISIEGELSIYEDPFNISDEGLSDGWIDITVSGGIPPYNYSWDNGSMDEDLEDIPAGTYTVYIDDDGGCQGTATFTLIEPKNLDIANALSPNGDGMNDYLIIKNVEYFPNNKLIVMNRWGDVVYEKAGYNNDWDGKANKGVVLYGKKLPEGSYFYIFDPGDPNYKKMEGYIIIN
ncbi:HYR domain-containing protein [Paracrocinitomix mangrovi]|uniref:HYR domain-containing protein n=1 Tax=Paracrocinitomix mangrovi TaxID=2862509 RepID=UPI001C8D068E|nr:HYR domain-containing protein [Paracrocinitomix mangrovi]UKN01117.1 HYR domain-containing protein [Paracrocinitomix mangrovi]